jgi:hypothetical protein
MCTFPLILQRQHLCFFSSSRSWGGYAKHLLFFFCLILQQQQLQQSRSVCRVLFQVSRRRCENMLSTWANKKLILSLTSAWSPSFLHGSPIS